MKKGDEEVVKEETSAKSDGNGGCRDFFGGVGADFQLIRVVKTTWNLSFWGEIIEL